MTAEFLDTLFLGAMTYLAHSTVFLALALAVTSLKFIKNISLKEMILRVALFGALITTPLHLSGAFNSFVQPINLSEQTLKIDPVSMALGGPEASQINPAAINPEPAVTRATGIIEASPVLPAERSAPTAFTLANSILLLWGLFGALFLFQLGYLVLGLKVQLAGRRALRRGIAPIMAKTLAKRAGMKTPKLSTKKDLAGPFCLVWGEIILPEWAETLPPRQFKAMIAHEVAHLRRADPAWILATRVVQSVFFFQPLNIFAARRLNELSEFACDAWAGEACGSGMPLAECLAECAKRHFGLAPSALGAAMATKRSPIVERTQMLLGNFTDYSRPAPPLAKAAVLAFFVAAATLIPVFGFEKITPKAFASSNDVSRSSYIMVGDDGEMDIKVTVTSGNSTMKIRGEGKFQPNTDETGFVSMSDGSYLDITETRDGVTRRVRYEGNNGRVEETYWLGGNKTSRDTAMTKWVAEVIPEMYRQTGIDVEGRTKRIYAKGGADAVLNEMALLPSSYIFRSYATTLVEIAKLDGGETRRFMEMAGEVSSSYDLRETLTAFVENQTLSDASWRAFAEASANISSSYDLRETLIAAAENFSGPAENWRLLLEATGNISSSYDLRETLVAFKGTMPKDDATMARLAGAAGNISSSYDLRETLSSYANEGGFGTGGWLALLGAAEDISSSYDLRETLVEFADNMPRDDRLVAGYRALTASISGEYDREQAEEALD